MTRALTAEQRGRNHNEGRLSSIAYKSRHFSIPSSIVKLVTGYTPLHQLVPKQGNGIALE